jgi:hypothetical protein
LNRREVLFVVSGGSGEQLQPRSGCSHRLNTETALCPICHMLFSVLKMRRCSDAAYIHNMGGRSYLQLLPCKTHFCIGGLCLGVLCLWPCSTLDQLQLERLYINCNKNKEQGRTRSFSVVATKVDIWTPICTLVATADCLTPPRAAPTPAARKSRSI